MLKRQEKENEQISQLENEIFKLNRMFRDTAVPAFAIDANSKITHWNAPCEMLTGARAVEVIGTDRHQDLFYEFRRPLMADLVARNAGLDELNRYYKGMVRVSQLLETGYEGDDFFPRLGDSGKWLSFTAAPLHDVTGRTVGAIETIQDISQRRQTEAHLRHSEIRYRRLFESADDASFLLVEDKAVDCNRKALTLFKCDYGDLLGRTILDFSPESQPTGSASRDEIEKIRRMVDQTASRYFDWRFCKKDGSSFDAEVSISRFEMLDAPCAIAIVRDVTEKKRLIEALRRREQELDEKSRYLEKVNQALKAALDYREVEKRSIEENILSRVKQFINPYLVKLGQCHLDADARAYLKIAETNLSDLLSQFSHTIFAKFMDFTPTEVRVANFIREGHDTKEIAQLMGLSPSSIQWHRKNIRAKLGLSNKNTNLYNYLNAIPR